MSKAFGLAGLRLGYCFASELFIGYFNRTKIPWNVSLLALAAALAAVADTDDQRRKWEDNKEGRDYLTKAIDTIPGLKAVNSEGNFVLIDAGSLGKDSQVIRDELIERGVFVRPMSPHHMRPGFMRVTVGTPEHNRRFIEILRDYVAEVSPVSQE
jgi:histidinol-phosphate aminotransferase